MPLIHPKRLFFVAYGGAHIQIVLPVIRAFKELGHETIILALTTAQPLLKQLGIDCISFSDLVEPGDEAALAMGKQLAADLPTPPIDEAETYAYLGLSYHDLGVRLGENEAAKLYAEKNRQSFEPITILERALKTYKPDMVVVTSSPRSEKAAGIAARNLGIPAVCLVDLFGLFTTWAADKSYTDKLLVFSDITRDALVKQGRPAKDIVVTGNPTMDRLADSIWQKKGAQWRQEHSWENKKIIFWASQPEPEPYSDLPAHIDKAVLKAIACHEDWRLIARFHPSEPVRFTEAGPQVYVSPKEEELTPLLFASDVCLTINSTVGLEGAIIGKPLVTVDMSVFTYMTPFADMGISMGAKSLEEIEPLLVKAVSMGAVYPKGLPRIGGATQAVVDEIISMFV